MQILVDKQQQLNYNPLVVYFMLNSEDFKQYGKHIASLNKYSGFTRGIFKFHAILRGDKYSDGLTEALTQAISKFNVILRLVDDENGNFNYALGKMNFNQDPDLFEVALQRFVVEACRYNIKTLKSQSQYYTDNSDASIEQSSTISTIAQSFKDAIALKGFKRGVWRNLVDPESCVTIAPIHCCNRVSPPDLAGSNNLPYDLKKQKREFADKLPKHLRGSFDRLLAEFEKFMGAPNKVESDRYAKGAIDKTKSKDLIVDYKSRVKTSIDPNSISITIAQVPISEKTRRCTWGVVINVNGADIPIHISSTEGAVIYIATLLKQKMGLRLERRIFRRNLPQKECDIHQDVKWLHNVCRAVRPAIDDFKEWYERMRDGVDGRTPMQLKGIDQGKNLASVSIKKCLQKKYADALYYCDIQPKGRNSEGCYYINLPARNIIVPQEFQKCLSV